MTPSLLFVEPRRRRAWESVVTRSIGRSPMPSASVTPAAADVYFQPNTGPEPFGTAFVEALYAALPVVGTNVGGAAGIVTQDCGVLRAVYA